MAYPDSTVGGGKAGWISESTLYLLGAKIDSLSPCKNVRNLGHFRLTAEP